MPDSANTSNQLFPPLRRVDVLACQTSAWYPALERKTIKTTIITGLGEGFRAYLESDGLIIPGGDEELDSNGELSSDDDKGSDPDDESMPRFSFPELDRQIRHAISAYNAVFPKLNWTAPKAAPTSSQDAGWMLASSGPLRCTSPADVYLLLKSSDFAMHDLDNNRIFEGCVDGRHTGEAQPTNGFEDGIANGLVSNSSDTASSSGEKDNVVQLELVLKKWYEIERSREVRCFIRENCLLAISQRDPNFFEHLLPQEIQNKMRATVLSFWQREIRSKFANGHVTSYVMDLLLTRDLSRAHVVDFNPYAPRTDPLLFEWLELAELHTQAQQDEIESRVRLLHLGPAENSLENEPSVVGSALPLLRIVTSPNQSARPMYSHNMIPADAFSDNAMQFATEMAVEMAQREREAQEAEARISGR